MNSLFDTISERAVILAPQGRDALVAAGILREGGLAADICNDLHSLTEEIAVGAGMAVLTDDAIRNADIKISRLGSIRNRRGRIFRSSCSPSAVGAWSGIPARHARRRRSAM